MDAFDINTVWQRKEISVKICNDFSTLLLCIVQLLQLLLKYICYPLNSGDLASLRTGFMQPRNVNASRYFARTSVALNVKVIYTTNI